jgi:GWxTD domain-containing protein
MCRFPNQLRAATAAAFALAAALTAACGGWSRVGSTPEVDPGEVVPQLFDVKDIYRQAGLMSAPEPIPFVGGFSYFAGPAADSTVVVLGLSFPNRSLSYRRSSDAYEARYRVEVRFQRDGRTLNSTSAEETVRLPTLEATQKSDERVAFQQYVTLPPDAVVAQVTLRDRYGGNTAQVVDTLAVPRFEDDVAFSSLVPIWAGAARPSRTLVPDILANPRRTVSYGTDTLAFYVEAYGVEPGAPITLSAFALDNPAAPLWTDTLRLAAAGVIPVAMVMVEPERLPMGELRFDVKLLGGTAAASTTVLVAFSPDWVVGNFEETLSLLRFFGPSGTLEAMGSAPIEERPAVWKAFWDATDPDPETVEHEAMIAYFRRLQTANGLFVEPAKPGWLTDRGEVYISLGAPDETFDQSAPVQGVEGARYINWTYITWRLDLVFWDRDGFGHFLLTPESRQEFQEALSRIMRGG